MFFMIDIALLWRRDGGRVPCYLFSLASVAFAVGCDGANDVIRTLPFAGSGGGGAGGSSAGTAGSPFGGEGGGGAGGTETGGRDAGADAASPEDDCVVGTLEQYCSVRDCPAFADARSSLRSPPFPVWRTQVIVQRPCTTPNGAARISVSADYQAGSLTYVYDAATLALVAVEFIDDDLGRCSGAGVEFGDNGFGVAAGYFGEASPDCGPGYEFYVPPACGSLDAGAPEDGGPDGGRPSECILIEP
jgi:hypothetical protein